MSCFPSVSRVPFGLSAALLAAGFVSIVVLGACNSGEKSLTEVDPDAVTLFPSYDQVASIVERNCVPCHKGDGPCLNPEPDGGFDPNFDSCDCLRAGFGLLLKVVDENTMPPGAWPRLTSEEKQILHNWADAGMCGPCNEDCGN